MQAHPRRIAKNDVETTVRHDVGEVDDERKGQRTTRSEPASLEPQGRGALTERRRVHACIGEWRAAIAEEITPAHRTEQVASQCGNRHEFMLDPLQCNSSFLAVQLPDEGRFATA